MVRKISSCTFLGSTWQGDPAPLQSVRSERGTEQTQEQLQVLPYLPAQLCKGLPPMENTLQKGCTSHKSLCRATQIQNSLTFGGRTQIPGHKRTEVGQLNFLLCPEVWGEPVLTQQNTEFLSNLVLSELWEFNTNKTKQPQPFNIVLKMQK